MAEKQLQFVMFRKSGDSWIPTQESGTYHVPEEKVDSVIEAAKASIKSQSTEIQEVVRFILLQGGVEVFEDIRTMDVNDDADVHRLVTDTLEAKDVP